MRKVNLEVIRPWVTKRVVELVGFEDEVVVEYAMELLEDQVRIYSSLSPLPFEASQLIFFFPCSLDTRSTQNANQPNRFPHKRRTRVYARPVEAPARSTVRNNGCASFLP